MAMVKRTLRSRGGLESDPNFRPDFVVICNTVQVTQPCSYSQGDQLFPKSTSSRDVSQQVLSGRSCVKVGLLGLEPLSLRRFEVFLCRVRCCFCEVAFLIASRLSRLAFLTSRLSSFDSSMIFPLAMAFSMSIGALFASACHKSADV